MMRSDETPRTWHAIRRRDWPLLMIVLFVAALLRFGQPGIVEFFHDDAMLTTLAQNFVSGGDFPLVGILSSVGVPNPPAGVLVMSVPFSLSPDPQFAIAFIMLLNVVGVGLLWLMAHRLFGRTVALVAGLSYALSPWAIYYSRKIWAQDFHTPFILLGLLLALEGFLRGRRWAQALCLPVLIFGMQIHFAAWALLPLFGGLLIWGRQRVSLGALALSIVLALGTLTPYAIGLSQTLSDDPTRITDALSRSSEADAALFSLEPLRFAAYQITGLGLETWVTPDQPDALLRAVPPPSFLWLLLGALTLLGSVAALERAQRGRGCFVMAWALLPVLIFIPQWTRSYPHYFVASLPAWMLLIALGVDALHRWLPEPPEEFRGGNRNGLLAVLVLILLTQGLWWRGMLRYVDITPIAYPGFTTPWHYLDALRDDLNDADDVLILSHGMAWDLHHEVAVWEAMLHQRVDCVRTLQPDGYAVLPDGPFRAVIAPDAPDNPVRGLYEQDAPLTYATRPGAEPYRVYRWDAPPQWNAIGPPLTTLEPVLMANGVALTGYALEDGRVYLRWRLDRERIGENDHYSASLLNADEERIAQHDAPFWQGRHWCAGDTLITWGPLLSQEPEARPVTLRVSQYSLQRTPEGFAPLGIDILDPLGNPAGQWVEIQLE